MRPGVLAAAVAVVLVTGVVHGLMTDRWGAGPDQKLTEAAARLGEVPLQLGRWEGEPQEMPERERQVAGVAGYARRWYWHRELGEAAPRVWLSLVCGRPRDVGAHTPDVCYSGQGYRLMGEPKRREVPTPDGAAAFWVAEFRGPPSLGSARCRVWWSWSDGDGWQAPEMPRWTFAGRGALYKLTVLEERTGEGGPPGEDPGLDFLSDLLPRVRLH